jgi:hypothetical protein
MLALNEIFMDPSQASAIHLIAYDAPVSAPPPSLKERLLERIAKLAQQDTP